MKRREIVKAAVVASALPWNFGQAPAWQAWRVNGERVNGWLKELSRFGANPDGGVSRVGFSDFDVEGRTWIIPVMRAAGLEVAIDPVGNIIGKRPGADPGLLPLLFGSHID